MHTVVRVFIYYPLNIVQFQKISILLPPPTPTEGIGLSWGVGGSVRPKYVKKCMKLKLIGISRGVGGLRKNPFHGGAMDHLHVIGLNTIA